MDEQSRLQSEHAQTLAFSDLHQKIYADYLAYVADQDAFLLRNRHTPWEISEAFPCPEHDIVRSFVVYQQRRTAFLHSSVLRSETHQLRCMADWIAFSATVTYTFALYLWIRNHEMLTVRYFVAPHNTFALPHS